MLTPESCDPQRRMCLVRFQDRGATKALRNVSWLLEARFINARNAPCPRTSTYPNLQEFPTIAIGGQGEGQLDMDEFALGMRAPPPFGTVKGLSRRNSE